MTTITLICSTNDIDNIQLRKQPPRHIKAAVAAPTTRAGPDVDSFFLNVFSFLLYWWVLKNLEYISTPQSSSFTQCHITPTATNNDSQSNSTCQITNEGVAAAAEVAGYRLKHQVYYENGFDNSY